MVLQAVAAKAISCDVLHADTTSFFVHDVYETVFDDTLEIIDGYSTDNRRDLRRFKPGLGISRTGIPVLREVLRVNALPAKSGTQS